MDAPLMLNPTTPASPNGRAMVRVDAERRSGASSQEGPAFSSVLHEASGHGGKTEGTPQASKSLGAPQTQASGAHREQEQTSSTPADSQPSVEQTSQEGTAEEVSERADSDGALAQGLALALLPRPTGDSPPQPTDTDSSEVSGRTVMLKGQVAGILTDGASPESAAGQPVLVAQAPSANPPSVPGEAGPSAAGLAKSLAQSQEGVTGGESGDSSKAAKPVDQADSHEASPQPTLLQPAIDRSIGHNTDAVTAWDVATAPQPLAQEQPAAMRAEKVGVSELPSKEEDRESSVTPGTPLGAQAVQERTQAQGEPDLSGRERRDQESPAHPIQGHGSEPGGGGFAAVAAGIGEAKTTAGAGHATTFAPSTPQAPAAPMAPPVDWMPAPAPGHTRSVVLEVAQPDLGRVNIRVAVNQDLVHTYFTSDRSDVGQFLANGQEKLQAALQNAGLDMGQFRVDIDRQSAGRSFQHQPQQYHYGYTAQGEGETRGLSEPDVAGQVRRHGMLNVVA